jgi:hypothetical protein
MAKKKSKVPPKSVEVHYIKTGSYRSYHADGVFGGFTPSGKLYMELFIQRSPTPQIINYEVTQEGMGKELSRTGKKGLIRQIEAGFVMDMEIAKVIRDWIDEKMHAYERIKETVHELDKETGK